MAAEKPKIGSRDRYSYSSVDVRTHQGILSVVQKVVEKLGNVGVFLAAGECWPELLWRAGRFQEMEILTSKNQFSIPGKQLLLASLCDEKEGFRRWLKESVVPEDMGAWLAAESGKADLTPDEVKALIWDVIADAVTEVKDILFEEGQAKSRMVGNDVAVTGGRGVGGRRSDIKRLGERIEVGDKVEGNLFIGQDRERVFYVFFETFHEDGKRGIDPCYFFGSPLIRERKNIPVIGQLYVRGLDFASEGIQRVVPGHFAKFPVVAKLAGFTVPGGVVHMSFVVGIEGDSLSKQLVSPKLSRLPVNPPSSFDSWERLVEEPANFYLPYRAENVERLGRIFDSFAEVGSNIKIPGVLEVELNLATNAIKMVFSPDLGSKCAYISIGDKGFIFPCAVEKTMVPLNSKYSEFFGRITPFIESIPIEDGQSTINFTLSVVVSNVSMRSADDVRHRATGSAISRFDYDVDKVVNLVFSGQKKQ